MIQLLICCVKNQIIIIASPVKKIPESLNAPSRSPRDINVIILNEPKKIKKNPKYPKSFFILKVSI